MSLDRLREWYADHPGHRGGKAAQRVFLKRMRRAYDSQMSPDELHADAIAEDESRARPRRREPDYGAEMKLPEGKTCGDCWHVKRCRAMGFSSSEANTRCDFHPRRFVDAGFPDDGWRQAAVSAIRERFAA